MTLFVLFFFLFRADFGYGWYGGLIGKVFRNFKCFVNCAWGIFFVFCEDFFLLCTDFFFFASQVYISHVLYYVSVKIFI